MPLGLASNGGLGVIVVDRALPEKQVCAQFFECLSHISHNEEVRPSIREYAASLCNRRMLITNDPRCADERVSN